MCITPLVAYCNYNAKGYIDQQLSFKERDDEGKLYKEKLYIPCRNCIICQAKRRAELSALMEMERETTKTTSSFITLTYNDRFLPKNNGVATLNYCDISQFIKSLKEKCRRHGLYSEWKYILSGEYGGKTHRPHYHIVIFGFNPQELITNDLQYYGNHPSSNFIRECWNKGIDETYTCNKAMCLYTAGYSVKKLTICKDNYLKQIQNNTKIRKDDFLKDYKDEMRDIIKELKEINKNDLTYNTKKAISEILTKDLLDIKYNKIGRKQLNPYYPCGRCFFYKNEIIQAEKIMSSKKLGLDFWNEHTKDFYKGFIVMDPFDKKKISIPKKFMDKLKDIDFNAWEQLKITKGQNAKEWNKQEQQRIKEKIERLNILTDRKLDLNDFEPINEDEYKFTQFE